jgi:hypothetical protein
MGGLNPWRPIKLTLGFGICLALFSVVFIPIALANHASPSPVGELVRKAEYFGTLSPETQFAYVDFQEPNVVWEMRRVTDSYGEAIPESQVLSYLNEPGPRAVVLSTARWNTVKIASDSSLPKWETYRVRGFNAAKGTFIDLTLVTKVSKK